MGCAAGGLLAWEMYAFVSSIYQTMVLGTEKHWRGQETGEDWFPGLGAISSVQHLADKISGFKFLHWNLI